MSAFPIGNGQTCDNLRFKMKIEIMTCGGDLLFFVLVARPIISADATTGVSGVLKAINIKGNLPQAIDDGAPRLIKRHSEFLI